MKTKNAVLFLFCLALTGICEGQIILVDSYYYVTDEIDEDTQEKIIDSVEDALKDYVKYAGLAEEEGGVSQANINRFKNLFASNARILKDYSSLPGQINFSDYAGEIFEYLSEEGLKFDMYGALIDVISYDSTGYYQVDIVTQKFVYNGLQSDRAPFYCKKGRRYKLLMSYRVPADDLSVAKIEKISGTLEEDCDESRVRISVGANGGYVQTRLEATDFKEVNMPNLSIKSVNGSEIGVGLRLQYPIVKSKALYVSVGGFYQYTEQDISIGGTFQHPQTDVNGDTYRRLSTISNGIETLKIGSAVIPVGLRWHAWGKEPFYFFIDGYGTVAVPLHGKSEFVGEGVFSGIYPDGRIEQFNVTETEIVPDNLVFNNKPDTRINYSFTANFSFQYAVTPNWAIETAVSYTHGLSNLLRTDNPAEEYPLMNNGTRSLTEAYTEDFMTRHYRLYFGMIYKL